MNYLLYVIPFLFFSFVEGDEVKDYLQAGTTIHWNEQTFHLVWSSKNDDYYIQEYLVAGDSLNHFSEMVSLFVLNKDIPLEDAVRVKMEELKQMKKSDPIVNFAVTSNSKYKGDVLDFLVGQYNEDTATIVEFNAYRYLQMKIGSNKKALLVIAYSKRAYSYEIAPFLSKLKENREQFVKHLFEVKIPNIKIAE